MLENLKFIAEKDKNAIIKALRGYLPEGGRIHVTNGGYSLPQDKIVPTMLAGFQFLHDFYMRSDDIFVLAVNSDSSMVPAYLKNNTPDHEREGQYLRAQKMAQPLATLFPHVPVIVMFYDEATPTALYESLEAAGLPLRSLHKWGYGTGENVPKIEGAELFESTLAFPLPHEGEVPFFHGLTDMPEAPQPVDIFDLRQEVGMHGAPYISYGNKVLFAVPPALASFAAAPDGQSFTI
ncbi:MAG: hypothetical protein AB7E85_08380 [Pseudobdellovibrionaceae bacterium]